MTTARLLWGMTWRGAGCGLLSGLALGALPGMLIIVSAIALMLIFWNTPMYFAGEELFFAELITIFILVAGLAMGTTIGLTNGISCGLLVGVLTRVFFFPLKNARRYRRVIGAASIVIGMAITLPLFLTLFNAIIEKIFTPQMPPTGHIAFFVLMVIAPVLIEGLIAFLIGQIIALWYINAMKGVTPNA